jgi:hypothetical protein
MFSGRLRELDPTSFIPVVVAAAVALAASSAHADGFRFDGDVPDMPHVFIDLTPAQLEQIARPHRAKRGLPEIILTPEQRARLREAARADVRWLFVARKDQVAGDCTCGVYNLGILVGERLAVLLLDLGDHLSSTDLRELERSLVDPKLAHTSALRDGTVVRREALEPDARNVSVLAQLPFERFEQRPTLSAAWQSQILSLPAVPGLASSGADELEPLHFVSAVRTEPTTSPVEWPKNGARLERDGAVFLLVPGVAMGEVGPNVPAWFLLEFRSGHLAAAAVVTQWSANTIDYAWFLNP